MGQSYNSSKTLGGRFRGKGGEALQGREGFVRTQTVPGTEQDQADTAGLAQWLGRIINGPDSEDFKVRGRAD